MYFVIDDGNGNVCVVGDAIKWFIDQKYCIMLISQCLYREITQRLLLNYLREAYRKPCVHALLYYLL